MRKFARNVDLAALPFHLGQAAQGAGQMQRRTIDGDDLVGALDGLGIAASTGSACHARSIEPSHVLSAMTGSRDKASRSVRFSLSHLNTTEEVVYTVEALRSAIALLC